MPTFHYTALAGDGATVRGDLEAPDRSAAIQRLQDQGLLPIEAAEVATGTSRRVSAPKRLPARAAVRLMRQLATLLEAGVALERSLAILRDLQGDGRSRALVDRLHARPQHGGGHGI